MFGLLTLKLLQLYFRRVVLSKQLFLTVSLVVLASAVQAQVVINEIHYNPPSVYEDQGLDVEFLELFNPTEVPIDLSGVSLSGIEYVFPSGSVIAPFGYVVLAPVIADAELTWGVTPFGVFGGGLSGKGETIQLIASDGTTIIDALTYDDNSPWPGAPDGSGPSLELINPALDNSIAESWSQSLQSVPTPGTQNSVFSDLDSPSLNTVAVIPGAPAPNIDFSIQVDAPNADSPQFYYRINFDDEIGPSPLSNVAGDTWAGTIPAQQGGALVRFRFENGSARSPAVGDTINYHGVVVVDGDLATTQLPTFQFYISDSNFSGLYDTPFDDDEFPVAVAYGSQVIDNARIRVRGASSRKRLKKSYKVELPDGYNFNLGIHSPYPLDEFAWQADRGDVPFNATLFAWDAVAEEGEPNIANLHIRLEKNGDFFGLYRLQEIYDASYRREHAKDEGQLFKAEKGGFISPEASGAFDKKHPDDEDKTAVFEASAAVNDLEGEDLKSWVYDNVDIPSVINYSALTSLLRHGDQEKKNYYAFRDDKTNRWSMLFWDLDQTWLYGSAGPCPPDGMTVPTCLGNPFLNAVLALPEFEAMHWRRTQSLVDKWLYLYDLEARREEVIGRISVDEAELDLLMWGDEGAHWDSNLRLDPYYKDRWEVQSLQRRRATFAAETRLPTAVGNLMDIVLNEIHYKPGDPNVAEFVELYNPNGVAVDLSGWSIEDGISIDIRYGTVIPANGYVVFTDEDMIFKNEYPANIFIGGQYSGGLKSSGERVALLDDGGILVDEVDYNNGELWPVTPDGVGPSLSLISPMLDNTLASSWVASSQFGGTPGYANGSIPAVPILTLNSQSFTENDANTVVDVVFTLDTAALANTEFAYETVDGSAISGSDFETSSGTILFPFGSTEFTVPIVINGDDVYTGDRAFTFSVVAISSGLVGDVGVVNIVDNEPPPDETPPEWFGGVITLLSATDQGLEFEWSGASDNEGVVEYLVTIGNPDGTSEQITASATTLTLSDLLPLTSYEIQVEAIDAALNVSTDGPASQLSTIAPPDTTAPVWTDASVSASGITGSAMTLSWVGASDNAGVTGYDVIVTGAGESNTYLETSTQLSLDLLLSSTDYQVTVQAQDAAGNTSDTGPSGIFTTLYVDTEAPYWDSGSVNAISIDATQVVLGWDVAIDNVEVSEYAVYVDGVVYGTTANITMPVTGLVPGTSYTFDVYATDSSGNTSVSPLSTQAATAMLPPLLFSTLGATPVAGVSGAADDAHVYEFSDSVYSLVIDAAAVGLLGAADIDSLSQPSLGQFYVSLTSSSNVPGLGNVLDRDILEYSNGAWSSFLKGRDIGLTTSGHDIDGLSVVGDMLYFSIIGNANVPGVGVTDDADILLWDGSSLSKVWDATDNGLVGGADIDGLTVVNEAHFYVSFNSSNTALPGIGNVQDEDIAEYNNGTWSVYLDGTANGLTSSGHDIDGFHVGGSDTTAPLDTTAPTWLNPMLTTQSVTSNSIALSWTGASDDVGVTEYQVSYEDAGNVQQVTAITNAITLQNLTHTTNYLITVEAIDRAGNVSAGGPSATVQTDIYTPPTTSTLYFSTVGNSRVFDLADTPDDADIYGWDASEFTQQWDASSDGLASSADVDALSVVSAQHFYLSFLASSTSIPGVGTVQDEDIVEYNNGVWSVYFDGTFNGLTGGGHDIDAMSISDGTLYFSTVGGSKVSGIGLPDDSDIYSYSNGVFERVWDATNAGLPSGADVDALNVLADQHYLLSFNGSNTTIAGLGSVQDEDVVEYNNGIWTLYFDGTSNGLTSGGHDIDALSGM